MMGRWRGTGNDGERLPKTSGREPGRTMMGSERRGRPLTAAGLSWHNAKWVSSQSTRCLRMTQYLARQPDHYPRERPLPPIKEKKSFQDGGPPPEQMG